MKIYVRFIVVSLAVLTLTFCVSMRVSHPAYMSARGNLNAARVMIAKTPENRARTIDTREAVFQIDGAIGEIDYLVPDPAATDKIQLAADSRLDTSQTLNRVIDLLSTARMEVSTEETSYYAKTLQGNTLTHIDSAIRAMRRELLE